MCAFEFVSCLCCATWLERQVLDTLKLAENHEDDSTTSPGSCDCILRVYEALGGRGLVTLTRY